MDTGQAFGQIGRAVAPALPQHGGQPVLPQQGGLPAFPGAGANQQAAGGIVAQPQYPQAPAFPSQTPQQIQAPPAGFAQSVPQGQVTPQAAPPFPSQGVQASPLQSPSVPTQGSAIGIPNGHPQGLGTVPLGTAPNLTKSVPAQPAFQPGLGGQPQVSSQPPQGFTSQVNAAPLPGGQVAEEISAAEMDNLLA